MNNLPVTGEQIRDYQILGRIGAGGMGVVFYARDLKLDRPVALKFLPGKLSYTAEEKRSLLLEARVISALDHPNICTIFDLEETEEGQVFIVMGYYDGGTLADRIGGGAMPLPEILDLLAGIARGLSAAHTRRIVHRDIKPSNILLTQQNVVKIVDFGLAKIVSSSSQTQSIDSSGTVAYMAPEQIRGGLVDQRTDIWAVGVLAAEMAGGVHPFKRDNLAAVAFAICNDPPAVAEDAAPGLQQIIYKCLSKDPGLRYQSCDELLADIQALRQALGGAAVLLSGPGGAAARALQAPGSAGFRAQQRSLKRSIAAASGPRQAQHTAWRWWWVPAAVAAVAIVVLAVPALREHLLGAIYSPHEKHIAVLPFDSPDPGDAALAGGLMDSMTGAISNLDTGQRSLWVVPASVVRGQHVDDPSSALKSLGATMVVKGSIAHSGNAVTLTLNLINTESMTQVGAVSASSNRGDLVTAQRDVVVKLARLLNVAPPQEESTAGGGSAPAAYDLYLQALDFMQRFDKAGNLDLAIDRLRTAIGEDPRFALAYASMGEAYRLKSVAENEDKWLPLALSNCQQALSLNPQLPSPYVTLGHIHAYQGHSELAVDEFQRALSLDTRNPEAMSGLAWAYEHAGRLSDAEEEYKKALVLRPGDWYSNDRLALFYDRQGRYADAIAQMRQAIQLTPDNANIYYDLGAFYLEQGDPAQYSEAEKALKKSLAISPNYPAYGNLGLLYLEEKRYTDAAAMVEKALAIQDNDLLPWSYAELAYRWLHEDEKADAALAHMRALAETAVKTNPKDAESQSWMALAYARSGSRDQALPHIQEALALAPTAQQVLVNAVETYVMIADEGTAIRLMQQARQSNVTLADLKLDPRMQPLLSRIQ